MTTTTQVLASQVDDTLWLRPEGRGTFQTSPAVQEVAEAGFSREAANITVDLGACSGMDSTFMGMLSGLAKRARKKGGVMKVVGAEGKNQASLEELGLATFMTLGDNAPEELNSVREDMVAVCTETGCGEIEHILKCHEELCEDNEENQQKFKDVLEVLREQQKGLGS